MALAGAVFGLLAALVPPAVAFGRHLARGRALVTRVLVGLALAPLGLTPALLLVAFARMPFASASRLLSLVWVVIALWPRRAGGAEPPHPEAPHVPGPTVTLATLGLAALVLIPALAIPFLRFWSDAWFHAAAAAEVLNHGMPPQDPNFAGVPLYYPWYFHALLALLMSTTGLSAFTLQLVLNLWAAGVLSLAAAHFAAMLGGPRAAIWAPAIAVVGLNPIGWLLWLARALFGETHGLAQQWSYLVGVGRSLTELSYGFSSVQASLLDRFWTGTALTPAIALSTASAWSLADALARPSRVAWVRSGLIAAALTAFHPAYGVLTIAALMTGLVAAATWRSGRKPAVAGALSMLLVCALAYPYVKACSVPGVITPAHIGVYIPNVWALVLGFGPWWILAGLAFIWTRCPEAAARFARMACVTATIMALFVILPERNTEKIIYLAWITLVPFAAAGLALIEEWGPRGPALVRALALGLMVPTTVMFVIGAYRENREPGVLIRGDTPQTRKSPLATPAEAEAYAMLANRTPKDAVVIDDHRPTVNEPVPVLASRRAFCGALDIYLANHFAGTRWGDTLEASVLTGTPYVVQPWVLELERGTQLGALREEFLVRRGIQRSLFHDGRLDPQQHAYLAAFQAPLYLLVRRSDVSDLVWDRLDQSPDWTRAFHNAEMRVYVWAGGS